MVRGRSGSSGVIASGRSTLAAPSLLPAVGVNSPELVRRVVAANNGRIAATPPGTSLVSPEQAAGLERLSAAAARIRDEWDAFESTGGCIPLTEDLFGASQGNVGSWWRSGLLVLRGHVCRPLADAFPETVEVVQQIPGLLSAMWSVFGPGTELPEHRGDNAGGLRLLYGVSCPEGSGHSLDGRSLRLGEGETFVFDDTRPHAAWNRSEEPRVLLLADLLRPLPFSADMQNRSTQWIRHHLSPRYRGAAAIGAEWHVALNP